MKKNLFCILIGVCMAGAMLAVFLALQEGVPYLDDEHDLVKLREDYVTEAGGDVTEAGEWDPTLLDARIDFDGLKKINGDIIGWIYIPGTRVNNPIMQHNSDNVYYLHHSFRKEENVLGSIYIYKEFSSDFTDSHTILFGHNMASGQMFGELSNYSERAFWEKYPAVYLYLPDRSIRCTIYSAYFCSVYDETYRSDYEYGSEEYKEFIRHTKQMAMWKSDITPSSDDPVISLSTCTDDRDASRRFVVNCIPCETVKRDKTSQTEKEETNEKIL